MTKISQMIVRPAAAVFAIPINKPKFSGQLYLLVKLTGVTFMENNSTIYSFAFPTTLMLKSSCADLMCVLNMHGPIIIASDLGLQGSIPVIGKILS